MRTGIISLIWIYAMFLFQCTTKKEKGLIHNIANQFGTENVEIANMLELDSKHGKEKNVVITIFNPKNKDLYFNEEVESSVALIVLNELRKELNSYNNIKVVVISGTSTSEKKYSIDRLVSTLLVLKEVDKFFLSDLKKNFVDGNFIKDSTFNNIERIMKEITKNYGQISNTKIRGFEYITFKKYSSLKLIKIRFEITYQEKKAVYYVYVSEENKKICFIGINQEL